MFLPAANNVIWSLATGESHSQKDPQTLHLTALLTKHFEQFNASDIQLLLMFNSVIYTKMRKALGLPYVMEYLLDIKNMVVKAIAKASPDANGNYIERALEDIEKDESKSAFIKRIGKDQLIGQLIDLFVAGKYQ